MKNQDAMIQVKVQQLILSNIGFAVLLKGANDPRTLPIVIGGSESQSIALALKSVATPRPLTHDLMKNLMDFLECRLMRVEVTALQEGTFYASLIMERDGRRMELDARPSDSIALALRAHVPIYVARQVMEEAGQHIPLSDEEAASGEEVSHAEPPSRLEKLQQRLQRAIAQEQYEAAAKIRDEIAALNKTTGEN